MPPEHGLPGVSVKIIREKAGRKLPMRAIRRRAHLLRLASGLRATLQAQVPVRGPVAALWAGCHQVRQRYAEQACRFCRVWCPAFAPLDAGDPRLVASETNRPSSHDGFSREQDDGRRGTFDSRAHILTPLSAADYGRRRSCFSFPKSCGIIGLARAFGLLHFRGVEFFQQCVQFRLKPI
jgi:hypothetical protein